MSKVSAGSYDLNTWLHGGYEQGIVTTLYGSPGTGKTNFCLIAAVSQAKKGSKVIYVDTEGGFSSERIKQLLYDNGNGDIDKVLGNIFVLQPTSFNEQKDSFKQLLKHLSNQVSLVVVDGMTMLYRLDFASAREKNIEEVQNINGELARQMRILVEIARKRNLAVLVTNQTYSWDGESRMVAGDILKYWSKCLVELVSENGKRTAHMIKHRFLPEKSFNFIIVNEGVKKRGWL